MCLQRASHGSPTSIEPMVSACGSLSQIARLMNRGQKFESVRSGLRFGDTVDVPYSALLAGLHKSFYEINQADTAIILKFQSCELKLVMNSSHDWSVQRQSRRCEDTWKDTCEDIKLVERYGAYEPEP